VGWRRASGGDGVCVFGAGAVLTVDEGSVLSSCSASGVSVVRVGTGSSVVLRGGASRIEVRGVRFVFEAGSLNSSFTNVDADANVRVSGELSLVSFAEDSAGVGVANEQRERESRGESSELFSLASGRAVVGREDCDCPGSYTNGGHSCMCIGDRLTVDGDSGIGSGWPLLDRVSQHLLIKRLASATATTISNAFPALTTVGYLYIKDNSGLHSLVNPLPVLHTVLLDINIESPGPMTVEDAFNGVTSVGRNVEFYGLSSLVRIISCFNSLLTTDSISIGSSNLMWMNDSFNALPVTYAIAFKYNPALLGVVRSFESLVAVTGRVNFIGNPALIHLDAFNALRSTPWLSITESTLSTIAGFRALSQLAADNGNLELTSAVPFDNGDIGFPSLGLVYFRIKVQAPEFASLATFDREWTHPPVVYLPLPHSICCDEHVRALRSAAVALGYPCLNCTSCGNGILNFGEVWDDGVTCGLRDGLCSNYLDCENREPCLLWACVSGQCQSEVSVGMSCDDGDGCSVNDTCRGGGVCAGVPLECDDGDDCTVDACVNGDCYTMLSSSKECEKAQSTLQISNHLAHSHVLESVHPTWRFPGDIAVDEVSGDVLFVGKWEQGNFDRENQYIGRATTGSEPRVIIDTTQASINFMRVDWSGRKVYYSAGNTVERANLDGSGVESVTHFIANAFDVDASVGIIYYSSATKNIEKVGIDGGSVTTLVSEGLAAVPGVVRIDVPNAMVYWDSGLSIQRVSVSGGTPVTILGHSRNQRWDMVDIAIDSLSGKLYWCETVTGWVLRANLDGSSRELVLDQRHNLENPWGLAIDTTRRMLYVTDSRARDVSLAVLVRTCLPGPNCSLCPIPSTGACDDRDPCTEDDVCDGAGICVGVPLNCDDGNNATLNVCADGSCMHLPQVSFECSSSQSSLPSYPCPSLNCSDGNPCTTDYCDTTAGACVSVNADVCCDDGLNCTMNDWCSGGVCEGQSLVCTANDPCFVGVCDESSGSCVFTADPSCSGTCVNGSDCDDGDACTENDACLNGHCSGEPVGCVPESRCLFAVCADGECWFSAVPDGVACNDSDACTGDDACVSGVCVGQAVDCDDGNVCSDDVCVEGGCTYSVRTGPCVEGNVTGECEDGLCVVACVVRADCPVNASTPCLSPVCVDNVCVDEPLSAVACDDGDACSLNDTCVDGACVGVPKVCPSSECTGSTCLNGTCIDSWLTEPCDDGLWCIVSDRCTDGVCSGEERDCRDDQLCTADLCVEAERGCAHVYNMASCDDLDPCTVRDACGHGVCAGVPMDCDDRKDCTADVCVGGQCVHTNTTGACANAVGEAGVCDGSHCVVGCRDPADCADSNPCTLDVCSAGLCAYVNTTGPCLDVRYGQDVPAVCVGSVCTPECYADADCATGVPCRVGMCLGWRCIESAADDGAGCSDGNDCTVRPSPGCPTQTLYHALPEETGPLLVRPHLILPKRLYTHR
jgi:hypothetical protein